jgi:outer membrane protein assembly factor BamE (lipoprotein component of BamABCDE complex)
MKARINQHTSRLLLAAGLACCAAATQAAGGITITLNQENAVAIGMSKTEVRQALGRPEHVVNFKQDAGPTWTYEVVGTPFATTQFEVTFGSDNRVASVGEMVETGR